MLESNASNVDETKPATLPHLYYRIGVVADSGQMYFVNIGP